MRQRILAVLKPACVFGGAMTMISAARVVGAFGAGHGSLRLLVAPPLTFAIYTTFAILVLAVGGAKSGGFDLNPWFAWLFCGGLVAFIAGALFGEIDISASNVHQHALRMGIVALVAWIILLSVIQAVWLRATRK